MGRPRRRWRGEFVGLAAGFIVSFAPAAFAQAPGQELARRAFEDGVALEKKAEYGAALVRFRESAAIKATLGNRYHIAYCLEMTGKLAEALAEYESLDQAAKEQKKSDVAEATRLRIEPLRARVPTLSIRVPPPAPADLTVTLDEAPVAPLLLDGRQFRVDPGDHVVAAKAPDRGRFTKTLQVAPGDASSVDVILPAAEPPEPLAVTEPPPEPPRKSHVLAIVATAGAGALAIGGVASFFVAGSRQQDAERACPTKLSCDSERTRVRTFDALALGGFVGAGALTVAAILLWTAKPQASKSGVQAALVARGTWLGAEGRF
jgi:hypothetical protein